MSQRWIIGFTIVTVVVFEQTTGTGPKVEEKQRFAYEYLQNYGSSWIADPEGDHYQFHLSEQSWSIAREYCLTLASDLVVIRSLEQLMWLTAHYPPNYSGRPERTVQIGLVLGDKENSTKKEWTWVDGTPFNATYLEWEALLVKNSTSGIPDPMQHGGRCAILSIDNLILRAIPCDKLPEFDYTNRFICQRTKQQHHEHEKKNNPLWEMIAQLISPLRNDETVKTEESRKTSAQLRGVKTHSVIDSGKTENVPVSGNESITSGDATKADSFLKSKKTVEETVVPADLDSEGSGHGDSIDDDAVVGKNEEAENDGKVQETGDEGKLALQAMNFSVEREPSAISGTGIQENGIQKNEDVLLAEAIERDFNHNAITANDDSSGNLNSRKQNKGKFQQPDEFCDENAAIINVQHDQRMRKNEKLRAFFRNLNLFLKHAKSTDLRELLDNSNSNKTLVERLKEAVNAKNNQALRKLDALENQKVLRNEIDDQQQQSEDAIQEEHDVGEALVREIDEAIDGDILRSDDTETVSKKQQKEAEKRSIDADASERLLHDTVQSAERSGKKEDGEGGAEEEEKATGALGRGLYEKIKEKLENKLIEHLKKHPDDSNTKSKPAEISEEIISNISEEHRVRNETSVQYYPTYERNPGFAPLSTAAKTKEQEEERTVGAPHTLLNNTHQTSKKSVIKLNNKFKNTFELPDGNTILFEQHKNAGNRSDIIKGIGRAVSDMEQILESAGEEIKRFFESSRTRI